ncbi:MAG: NAD-dependent epimerase/dehydratase family protein, partial [Candidatus Methylomirabilis sp.]|nr:NAD-dependent epimerase/dehydratase family protein [Deltaproteobacteria bacterium]
PFHPDRMYGVGKLLAEGLFQAAGRELGFRVGALRIGHVFGPFEHVASVTHEARADRLIPMLIRRCLADEPVTLFGSGDDLRDYVHSFDVAQAVLLAILRAADGEYLIGSGRSVAIREVFEAVSSAVGRRPEVDLRPRNGPKLDYRIDIEAARRTLGFEPLVSLAKGLAHELEWMRRTGVHV